MPEVALHMHNRQVNLTYRFKGHPMNRSLLLLMATALATLGLSACDRPVVVNPAPAQVATPGPAGPPGATGATGEQGAAGVTGSTGDAGKAGEGTTVVVMPAASAATN